MHPGSLRRPMVCARYCTSWLPPFDAIHKAGYVSLQHSTVVQPSRKGCTDLSVDMGNERHNHIDGPALWGFIRYSEGNGPFPSGNPVVHGRLVLPYRRTAAIGDRNKYPKNFRGEGSIP